MKPNSAQTDRVASRRFSAGLRDPARAARLAGAAALGGLQAASYAPPAQFWGLQLLALTGLLLLIRQRDTRERILLGTIFSFVWFAIGLSWLHTSMHVYGGMPWTLAALAVALFAGYLSVFPVLALAAAHRCTRHQHWLGGALTLGAFWGLSEILRGLIFTGFPWLAIGYAHVDGPLAGFAPWVGVYGISALAAFCSALLAAALVAPLSRLAGHRRRELAVHQAETRTSSSLSATASSVSAGLMLATFGCGLLLAQIEQTQVSGRTLTVRLLQGNIPQQLKFNPQRALNAMDEYTRLIESAQADLIVLPETAWTLPWNATPPAIRSRIETAVGRNNAALAIGMPLPAQREQAGQTRTRYTNSVALLTPAANSQTLVMSARYDKRHLVPFGEFIPTGFAWFVALMEIPLGEFGRGSQDQKPFEVRGQRFGFNICYEDLFGEELIHQIRGTSDATGASVLVNVSNIAWFGNSQALPQHLAIARMRALETGRPMLRSTNTGVTTAIDHRGTVLAQLAPYTSGALDVEVQGTSGLTAYVRAGQWLTLALLAIMLLGGQLAAIPRQSAKKLK